MASGAYTAGLKAIMDGTIHWEAPETESDTIKVMLLSTTTAYTYDPDHVYVDAGGAADPVDAETNVSGYDRGWGEAGRKALATRTMTVNNTNNTITFDATDPTAWTLAAGETVAAAVIIKEGAANDTTSQLLFYVDFTDTATNGGTFTLSFNASGIAVVTV
jgi:hypothetical protein